MPKARSRSTSGFFSELRRRRVFRTAGYYVVGAWLLLQAAEILFPGFGIPETAIRALFWAALAGFPVALVFGWLFDIRPDGIRRTASATAEDDPGPVHLAARDWAVLATLAIIIGIIAVQAMRGVLEAPPERVETGAAAAEPAAEAAYPKLDNSVAVLPFDNLSNDPDNAYFCDGIADEILNSLGRFAGLNIIGRTSSFAFRYDRPPAPRISEILGARFLLQGSVRQSGERVRISAQLLDERGVQLWSDTFDRELGDAFAIQSDIAETVALTVVPRISPAAERPHVPEAVAYDHYLRGRDALYRRDRPLAIREFERAIERDPRFAAAHAELAIILSMGVVRQEQLERAQRAVDKAQALEPGNARAAAAQGLLLNVLTPPDLEGAERALRGALAVEPNMVDALNWLAGVLYERGDDAAAESVLERGLDLDPLHPAIASNYASRLIDKGQPGVAERRLKRLVGVPGVGRLPYVRLMDLYREQGRLADRYALGNRMLRDERPDILFWFAESETLLGRWERARYWAEADRARVDDPDVPEYRKPFMAHFGTGLLVLQGRFREAHEALSHDPLFTEDGFGGQPDELKLWLGAIPAFAGDCARTVQILGPVLYRDGTGALDADPLEDRDLQNAVLTFAWCHARAGETERARAVVEDIEAALDTRARRIAHVGSELRFFAARNAAVGGDVDLAFERLQESVETGWRSLYYHAREPTWANLRNDPRAAALLERVEVDIAAERAKAEAMDAEWDPIEWHRRHDRLDDLGQPSAAGAVGVAK